MSQCEALVVRTQPDGKPGLAKESIPVPEINENQVLVKVLYVAQNPTDIQCLDINAFGDGAVLGCDFVGTVEKVGSAVTRVALNDTIAGLIWGDGMSLESATTIPLAATTAELALFSKDCLAMNPMTNESKTPVLIWGGSSSVGLFAVQLASMRGFQVLTTCSPRHFPMVESLGDAVVAFDYRDPDVIQKITQAAPNLQYVFDTIGNSETSTTASQAISLSSGGTLCTVRPGKAFTDKVTERTRVTDVLVWTAFLKDHRYKEFHWPANESDHRLCSDFFENLPKYIADERIKPNLVKLFENGLDDVTKGFDEYRNNVISGYKIVYKM